MLKNPQIAIIGLGYVGLPLAIEFAKQYQVYGYDINGDRIAELVTLQDSTNEANLADLAEVLDKVEGKGLVISNDATSIQNCTVYIITVPTPIDDKKHPDLSNLFGATTTIAGYLKKGDVVIYESTVYPGCTEEECVPILETVSKLKYNEDFFCGYSPERINPGDKVNTLTTIKKVTSGSNPQIAIEIDNLYASIITAGTYLAPSIKVAEAAKAIENAQRDINISFVNELALIFDKLEIDTQDVLEAAATKWNFLKFTPGLVGGHCIGVDPYYLAYKAQKIGYMPEVILSGRRVNDNMGKFLANKVIKIMVASDVVLKNANVLILGFAFKENCPDTRNTKVIDVVNELRSFSINVFVFDPLVNQKRVEEEYGINLVQDINQTHFDAVILTVAHKDFTNIDFDHFKKNGTIIFDTKGVIDRNFTDGRL